MTHVVRRLPLINAYLVQEDDGLTLIDTLIPGGAGTILKAAQALGAPIRRIAITHAHVDHVGSIDALVKQLPGVELVIGARDAKLLRKDGSPQPDEPQHRVRGLTRVHATPTRLVAAGDTVGSLQVIDARGHSPGQVAYLDPRDRTLYCGDAYTNVGGLSTTAKPESWLFAGPALVSWDKPLALESAKRLRDLGPARLAPGHGSVIEDPVAAMSAVIAKAS